MRDPHIRQILKQTELLHYLNDPYSKVVEELKIPAANARIDIAVINGHFHGYEIKSACDTLQRLPGQITAYSQIFDYLTIISEEKYYKKIIDITPDWVGVAICVQDKGHGSINIIKPCLLNNGRSAFHTAKLLWNHELVDLLQYLKIPFNKKHRNWLLCEVLVKNLGLNELSDIVRDILKKRKDWKLKEDYLTTSYDDFE